jgi:hypothetical protein
MNAYLEVMDDFERREQGLGPANVRVVERSHSIPTPSVERGSAQRCRYLVKVLEMTAVVPFV